MGIVAVAAAMATEIERKYLVNTALWRPADAGIRYSQGYLSLAKERVVRVRVAGTKGFLTIKGPSFGIRQFEYPIPLDDAAAMLEGLCERPLIDKTRHREMHGGHVWEIDVFHGENDGLVLAEIELKSVDERFVLPPWIDQEVSNDPRYFNNNLITHPFKTWGKATKGAH